MNEGRALPVLQSVLSVPVRNTHVAVRWSATYLLHAASTYLLRVTST